MHLKSKLRDSFASIAARLMRHFAFDPKYFELWQSHGYHVQPAHFYSPIPETAELSDSLFQRRSEMPGIDMRVPQQLDLLATLSENYSNEFHTFHEIKGFEFGKGSFESVDAEILYAMIREIKPKRFVEIGAGYSTLIAAKAMDRNRSDGHSGEMISIDPYPPYSLLKEASASVEVREQDVQSIPLDFFSNIDRGDVLFIDSSHVSKAGSDVNFEFLEVLPRLKSGVTVHIHDIFFPYEYPRRWVKDLHRFWNEQYLLRALLIGSEMFEVLWCGSMIHHDHSHRISDCIPSYDPSTNLPGSFWMERK